MDCFNIMLQRYPDDLVSIQVPRGAAGLEHVVVIFRFHELVKRNGIGCSGPENPPPCGQMVCEMGERVVDVRADDIEISRVVVAGNLADMFRQIRDVGRDVDIRGNVRTGSLLLEGLAIAGQ